MRATNLSTNLSGQGSAKSARCGIHIIALAAVQRMASMPCPLLYDSRLQLCLAKHLLPLRVPHTLLTPIYTVVSYVADVHTGKVFRCVILHIILDTSKNDASSLSLSHHACCAGLETAQNAPRLYEWQLCPQNGSLLYLGPQLCWPSKLQSISVVLGVHIPGNRSGYSSLDQRLHCVLQRTPNRRPTAICKVSFCKLATLRSRRHAITNGHMAVWCFAAQVQ